ncbi:hypothetical protein Adt_03584 [Abeliophyllum distichum]|uniref:Uncharacterized protein n=1 Tax=Abeliophyllum distichum TaxID=126358 RepID=A0ABD1VZ16_9LAMI
MGGGEMNRNHAAQIWLDLRPALLHRSQIYMACANRDQICAPAWVRRSHICTRCTCTDPRSLRPASADLGSVLLAMPTSTQILDLYAHRAAGGADRQKVAQYGGFFLVDFFFSLMLSWCLSSGGRARWLVVF